MKEITKKVYYSEALDKEFDSVEELNKAEEEQKSADFNSEKKKLAKIIETADDEIEAANKEYTDIRNEFEKRYRELKGEYSRKLTALDNERDDALSEKAKEIRKISDARYNALAQYNRQFGAYKKYLTNEEAEKERKRIINSIFSFPSIWDLFNW